MSSPTINKKKSKNNPYKVNKRYNRLVIQKEVEPLIYHYGKYKQVKCKCDCGNYIIARLDKVISGWTKSCGCLQKEKAAQRLTTHGRHNTPTYLSWLAMKARCQRDSQDNFKYYGGRGIKICSEWLESFGAFLRDMGLRPVGKTIDRINNNGNYEPLNCKWSTMKEQCQNRRPKLQYAQ